MLHCEAPTTSVPSPIARTRGVCIGAIVVAVIATMMAVTPFWIAHLHLYAWTGEINSLSLGRCKSTSSHRADKAKRKRGFCNRSHVAVLSVAPLCKRRFLGLIKRRFLGLITRHRSIGFHSPGLGHKRTREISLHGLNYFACIVCGRHHLLNLLSGTKSSIRYRTLWPVLTKQGPPPSTRIRSSERVLRFSRAAASFCLRSGCIDRLV